jgi:hypothetical protein
MAEDADIGPLSEDYLPLGARTVAIDVLDLPIRNPHMLIKRTA